MNGGHHRLCEHLGARVDGLPSEAARVRGAVDEGAHIADAITEMVAMPRDAACGLLPVDDEHAAAMLAREFARGRQPGRPGADDGDVHADLRAVRRIGHPTASLMVSAQAVWPVARLCCSIKALTSAPQKNPWQRPFIARVRRRSPSSPAGGISEV